MAKNTGPTEDSFKAGIQIGPDGERTGHITCYPSFESNCTVVRLPKGNQTTGGFVSLPEPTRFHDESLIKATQKINKILLEAAREKGQGSHMPSLHLYLTDDGPMLIWVDVMVMRTDDIRKVSNMSDSMGDSE